MLLYVSSWSVAFAPRECNFLAHNVAQWAAKTHFANPIPITSLPPRVFCKGEENEQTREPSVILLSSLVKAQSFCLIVIKNVE